MKYLYKNLTTNETTYNPDTAIRWWKRGDWIKAVSSVDKLIADYLDAGGHMLQMREGVLGGDVLLYDDAGKLKTYVIREVAINEWSSGRKVRGYNRMPGKYRTLLDKQR